MTKETTRFLSNTRVAPGSYTAAVSQSPVKGEGGGLGTDQLRLSKRLVSDVAREIGNAVGKCKAINTVIDRFILGSSIPLQLEQIIPTSSLQTDTKKKRGSIR